MSATTAVISCGALALDVQAIAPTHGLPILNVPKTMPKLQEGLLYGSSVPESGTETGLAPVKA